MARKKKIYSEELKREVIRLKLTGEYSNQELMSQFGIKNRTQIKTWMKWFRDGEEQRLAQPIGKQYTFGKGPEEISELEQLKRKLAIYEMREELVGKYQEIERKWF